MLRKTIFVSFLLIILLGLYGCQNTEIPTSTARPTTAQKNALTPTIAPTNTPEAVPAEIEVWLDEAIDSEAFPTDGCITVHFDQPMDSESAPFPLRINPYIEGIYIWREDFQSLTFLPIKEFKRLKEYRVRISSDLVTSTGAEFTEPPQWQLQIDTAAAPLSACSQIATANSALISSSSGSQPYVSRRPFSSNLPSNHTFTLRFSVPMDQESVLSALSVEPEIKLLSTWEENTLKVTLDEALSPGEQYQFTLANTARSLSGMAIKEQTWTYRTPAIEVDFQAREGLSRLVPFHFTFNYEMDIASVEQALSLSPAFEFRATWHEDHKKMILTPLEPLQPGTLVEFTLDARATSTIGDFHLPEAQTWSYLPPAVAIIVDGTYGRSKPSQIELSSNIPLDTESVAAALQISPAFEYKLEWSNQNKVFTVVAVEPLPHLTTYTLSFEGEILDKDGFPLSGLGSYQYTTPSPIVNEPEICDRWETACPIEPEAPFQIIFDRPMDPESTLAALTITPTITGEYSWTNQTTLRITPAAGHLDEYTEYTFRLALNALDVEGNPVLPRSYSWKVTTDGLPNIASFGEYGSEVQVVDLDGRRALHIANREGLETVQLELYRVTIQDFIEFDTNTYQVPWVYGRAHQPYDLSEAALQAAWEADVIRATGENYYNTAAEIHLPADIPEGLYVLNMITDHLDDQLLLVATRSTLAVKYSPRPNGGGPLMVWVSNINDYVLRNVEIRVYDRNGEQINTGITDEVGIYETTLSPGSDPYLVVARREGEITLAGISSVWRTRGWDGDISGRTKVNNLYFSYLYTDRPIYRPGQTVNYKGIVRRDDDADYRLPPAGFEAQFNLRDSRNNLIQSTPITLNAFGTFNGSFEIAEGALLGDYVLELAIGTEIHQQTFQVEDYQKPDIEVTIATDQAEYITGETISVTVDTQYLFGEPVTNADLQIKQYKLLPQWYCWYCEEDSDELIWFDTDIDPQRFTTDENGKASFELKASLDRTSDYYDQFAESTTWGLEVTADDGSNQHVSAFTMIKVYRNAADVQLELGGWLYEPNAPIPVMARFSSRFDEPISDQEIILEVEQRTSGWKYENYQTHQLTTGEDGLAFIDLELEEGSYKLILTGEDSQGRELSYERRVYVRDFTSTWLLDYTTDLTLVTEDRDYAPGETAEIIIESSFNGEGLLTIERGSVIEQRMIKIEAPFTTINVPIQPEFAPNVYVLVQAWEPQNTDLSQTDYAYESIPDSLLRWDAVELRVPDQNHRLTVEIEPEQEAYNPRQEATFSLRVTDASGEPVQAEVSLALVDEAIFLLADDPAGDIHAAFYQPRKLGVYYYDSLAPWRYLWMPERGGGGDDGSAGELSAPRSDFPDTVLWIPAVVTDRNGEATVTVTLPDTLTSWRLTAKAVTRDTLIGQGETRIVTQQPVVVRPLPPHNLTEGDHFVLSASVHNFSTETLDLTVSLEVEGFSLDDSPNQEISLASGEGRIISWGAAASEPGEGSFTLSASTPQGYGDAIQMGFPIQRLAIPVFDARSGQFSNEIDLTVIPVENALPDSQVTIRVDATVAASLLNGVEYLTGYPYGCVEQTMSRALPNAVVARAFQDLGMQEQAGMLALESKIAASVQRLYAFQHNDGGWGWWYDDPSTGYQTAWVVFGLATTAESGYPVDPAVIERGVAYLQENLDKMNPPTQVYALYAMTVAGHGDLETALAQTALVSELDHFSRASLALSLHMLGETERAQELLDGLLSEMVTVLNGDIHSPGSNYDGHYNRKFMSSNVRSTAMVLQALMLIQPDHEYREGMVQWLQSQRGTYGWGSTNETAFTILALTDYLLVQQSEAQDTQITIYLNDTLLLSETLAANNLTVETSIPVDQLSEGENQIRLEADAEIPLYYVLNQESFIGQAQVEAEGISLTRVYLDAETKEPVTEIQAGDLVLVRLIVVNPEDAFYVILEDHLPGGLEALNEGLNTTSHDVSAAKRANYGYYDWNPFHYDDLGYNNKEIRLDRVSFFITELSQGRHIFEYYARATVPGTFTALSAEIAGMYDATVWGRSASSQFVVNEQPR